MRTYQTACLVGLTILALIAMPQRSAAQEAPDKDRSDQETQEKEKPTRFLDTMGYWPEYFKRYHEKCHEADLNHESGLKTARKQELDTVKGWHNYLDRPMLLEKVIIHIEFNANRFHTIALLNGARQVPLTIEVSNDYVRHHLTSELNELPRVFYDAPVASKLGSMKLYFDGLGSDDSSEKVLEIGISDCGFIMGNGTPGQPQTSFYSWTLANFLADALKDENGGLSQLSFNILSGADVIGNPGKLNTRFASSRLREYWGRTADPWYSFPREMGKAANLNRIFPAPKDKYIRVYVVPCRFSVGDFEWFRLASTKTGVETDYEFALTSQWGDVGDARLSKLIQTRITFAGPLDITECIVMGVIGFVADKETDVFVTNKGFLWKRDGKYSMFHSQDLTNWLNSYLQSHQYDMSQNAANVLSGAESIVAARATHFELNMQEYNLRGAKTWYDIPESYRKASQAK